MKQTGRISYDKLVKTFAKSGYKRTRNTQGYRKDTTKKISFVVGVDDFDITYVDKQDLHHILDALKDKYEITEDLTGSLYCGLHLNPLEPSQLNVSCKDILLNF